MDVRTKTIWDLLKGVETEFKGEHCTVGLYKAQDDEHNNTRANRQDKPAAEQYPPNHADDNTEIFAKRLHIVVDKFLT